MKIKFLVNEQNVSVIYIDINAISWCLDLNIFQQDECVSSKLGLEVEPAKSNLKTPISQIWVICHLLPFVRVGQQRHEHFAKKVSSRAVVFRLFQKMVILPPNPVGFRLTYIPYPIVRHIFHPICILLELNTKVFIFFSRTWVL